MRLKDPILTRSIKQKLASFQNQGFSLPGIQSIAGNDCFTRQVVDSVRRIQVIEKLRLRIMSEGTQNPNSGLPFNPLKAAIWHIQNNNLDEAFWLVFLATHCGKHIKSRWGLATAIYGQLGNSTHWTWNEVMNNRTQFRDWLITNANSIKSRGKFGNHRKYESLMPQLIAEPFESYLDWIMSFGNHITAFNQTTTNCSTSYDSFKEMYKSMASVHRFGRTGKFDFLSMVGKLGLYNIQPNSTYLNGATGPLIGAQLLFGNDGSISKKDYQQLLDSLGRHLNIPFGMQVLEDAICNWQKNPTTYTYFGG